MKKQSITQSFLLTMLILITLTAALHADVYMKQKRHTDAISMMGQNQPARDVIEEVWITDSGFRNNSEENAMIVMFEKQKMIMINHKEKTYTEMPMNLSEMMSEAVKEEGADDEAAEEQQKMMQNMMQGMMKVEVSIQPTNESKVISGWKCKKYIMTMNTFMGENKSEIWATEDLKIDPKLYSKFSTALSAANPAMKDMAGTMMEEMKKIKGVQVLNVSTQKIMNQNISSSTELLDYKTGSAPGDLFQIPANYKKSKMK
jgi:hypothetical protein